MRLLIATPSPYARKVRIALLEKQIDAEIIVDNPWLDGAAAPSHNPLAKIPVLLLDSGEVLHDSSVIVEYLETLAKPPPLLPASGWPRVVVKQIEAVADGVCDAVVLTVLERQRAAAQRSADWLARQRGKIDAGLDDCQRRLDGRDWFVGETLSLADIAVACALGYLDLRLPDYHWRGRFGGLTAFATRVEPRPSLQKTWPKPQTMPTLG